MEATNSQTETSIFDKKEGKGKGENHKTQKNLQAWASDEDSWSLNSYLNRNTFISNNQQTFPCKNGVSCLMRLEHSSVSILNLFLDVNSKVQRSNYGLARLLDRSPQANCGAK